MNDEKCRAGGPGPSSCGAVRCPPPRLVVRALAVPGAANRISTNAGSPQWAAIVALAKQAKGSPLGFINPTLYQIACSGRCSQDFHDITIGNDELVNTPVGNSATTGWDAATGLGTPKCDEPGP